MARIITKKKEVSYEVAVTYDGTEFSAEKFGSIDAAKAEADKYDSSAKGIVTRRAMKVLKPYIVPGVVGLKFEDQCDAVKEYAKCHNWIQRLYTDPTALAINCIAASLFAAGWSCLEDAAEAVYIFKPKAQKDIDAVMQYLDLIGASMCSYTYDKKKYGELGAIMDSYKLDYNKEGMLVGKTYMLIVAPENDVTSVVDVHAWLNKVSAFVDDVDTKY